MRIVSRDQILNKHGIARLVSARTMMSMKSCTIYFQPQKSRCYHWYLAAMHVFAWGCTMSVIPWVMLPFCSLCALVSWRVYFSRTPMIVSLQYEQKREWILVLADHSIERAELLSSSVMMRHFLILHFNAVDSGIKRTAVLFSDSFSGADFQSLRRCVKMGFL